MLVKEIIQIKRLVQNTHMSQILNQIQIKETTNGKQVEVKIAITIIIQSTKKRLPRQTAQIVEIITSPILIPALETRVTQEIIHQVPITVHRVLDQNPEEVEDEKNIFFNVVSFNFERSKFVMKSLISSPLMMLLIGRQMMNMVMLDTHQ